MATFTNIVNGKISHFNALNSENVSLKSVQKPLIVEEKPKIFPKPKFLIQQSNSVYSIPSPTSSLSSCSSPCSSITSIPNCNQLDDLPSPISTSNPTSPTHHIATSSKLQSYLHSSNKILRPPETCPESKKPPVPSKPAKLREQLLQSLASESLLRNNVITSPPKSNHKHANNNIIENGIKSLPLTITPSSENESDPVSVYLFLKIYESFVVYN